MLAVSIHLAWLGWDDGCNAACNCVRCGLRCSKFYLPFACHIKNLQYYRMQLRFINTYLRSEQSCYSSRIKRTVQAAFLVSALAKTARISSQHVPSDQARATSQTMYAIWITLILASHQSRPARKLGIWTVWSLASRTLLLG